MGAAVKVDEGAAELVEAVELLTSPHPSGTRTMQASMLLLVVLLMVAA